MNQLEIVNKAKSIKALLRGAVNAMKTRSELIDASADTKFRLAFRCKVAALKTILIICRKQSDYWLYKNSDRIDYAVNKLRGWY